MPTSDGFAETELIADARLGTISVFVVCGGVSAVGTLEVELARLYLPLVVQP